MLRVIRSILVGCNEQCSKNAEPEIDLDATTLMATSYGRERLYLAGITGSSNVSDDRFASPTQPDQDLVFADKVLSLWLYTIHAFVPAYGYFVDSNVCFRPGPWCAISHGRWHRPRQ